MSKASEIRFLITKNELTMDEVSYMSGTIISLWKDAIVSLIITLELERILITSDEVKAVVMDDIIMANKNLSTLLGVELLQELNLSEIHLN